MSIFLIVDGEEGRWRKTISERLNSEAMDCFWVCVSAGEMVAGTWIMATGLPV